MLIIPIENKPEWSKPPIITISLLLINLLVFLLYQGNDYKLSQEAGNIYQQQKLILVDAPIYLVYLAKKNPELSQKLKNTQNEEARTAELIQHIIPDREFDIYLRDSRNIDSVEATEQWRQSRDLFEKKRNAISSYAAGMTPAEAKPSTFITSLFLHGGWDHLSGNMVFLFLFGFTLEATLKAHIYLLMYLASGVAANLLHLYINQGSYIPTIGASGAISGLMGMYLSLYRLRKIRFFYSVVFYFGEFTAPALFILPLWLLKELYGYFYSDSHTAYWAHIGGLIAGALMILLARKSQTTFNQQLAEKTRESESQVMLKKIQQAISSLDIEKAKIMARQLCSQQPLDPRPWRILFDLTKSQPQAKQFHEATFNLLKQFVAEDTPYPNWKTDTNYVLQQYRALSTQAPALSGNLCFALAQKFWLCGAIAQTEEFISLAQQKGIIHERMQQLLTQMLQHYQKSQNNLKAAQIAQTLKKVKEGASSQSSQ